MNTSGLLSWVDGSTGITVFIIDDLQHASAAESRKRLRARMLLAVYAANLVRENPSNKKPARGGLFIARGD